MTSSLISVDEQSRRVVSSPSIRPSVFITESYNGPPAPPAPHYDEDEELEGQEEEDVMDDSHANLLLPSISTLCNSAIGAGVLSLPIAFKSVGILGACVLCLTIASVEGFTLYVLAKMAERYHQSSYSGLVRAVLGKKTSAILSVLLALYMWGACVAYLIIMSDCVLSVVKAVFELTFDRSVVIGVIGLILTPLCCFQRITALSTLSSVAILGFVYTAVAICLNALSVVRSRLRPFDGIELYFTDWHSTLFAIPIIVFGFNCHANVVVVMHEMGPDSSSAATSPRPSGHNVGHKKSRKLISMILVIIASVALICSGYVSVGLAGYLTFGDSTPSNILNSLPQTETWSILARGLILIVVFGHYPLSHHPARSCIENLLSLVQGSKRSIVFTLIFVTSSATVASAVTDLGAVLHLLGGTVAALIIFGLPGAMLVNSAIVKDSKEKIMDEIVSEVDELSRPLIEELQVRAVKGIKKSGFIYSLRKSWIGGLALILIAAAIMALTVVELVW